MTFSRNNKYTIALMFLISFKSNQALKVLNFTKGFRNINKINANNFFSWQKIYQNQYFKNKWSNLLTGSSTILAACISATALSGAISSDDITTNCDSVDKFANTAMYPPCAPYEEGICIPIQNNNTVLFKIIYF